MRTRLPKKTHVPIVPVFMGTLKKCPQTVGHSIGNLLVVRKTFWVDFRDVLDRFRGCFGQISETFWADFGEIPGIYL
jgi:hypothetical protein